MATAKNPSPARRKPISAYSSTTAQVVVGTGRLGLGTARTFAYTRKFARAWADVVTPATGAVLGYLASGVDPDPLGPLGPGFDAGTFDSPWRIAVGATAATAAAMYQGSPGARSRRERRRVVGAFADIGAAEPPSPLHPKGRPVDVKLPTPTKAGSRVVVKVPTGASDKVMENLAPFLSKLGQVTVRPVPPPAGVKARAVATARRATPGVPNEPSVRDQLLAYGYVELNIRRREALNTPVTWEHLAEIRRPGFAGRSVWDEWHVGDDEDGERVRMTVCQRNKLTGGETGSGKSTCEHLDLSAVSLDPTADIYLLDPSELAELGFWVPVAQEAAGDAASCVQLLAYLHERGMAALHRMAEIADDREAAGLPRANVTRGERTTWIVIDELLALTAHPEQKVRNAVAGMLFDIVGRLRKVGYHVICSTLKPTGDVIPTFLRDLITLKQVYRCVTADASTAVLGDKSWAALGYGGHKIDAGAPRGVCYLLAKGGHPIRMRGAYLSDAERGEVLDTALLLRGLPERVKIDRPAVPDAARAVLLDPSRPALVADAEGTVVTLAKPAAATPVTVAAVEPAPEPPGVDEALVDEAAELAVKFGHVSAQMLQRKLRISWDDTAWVLAELEDRGVIGPARAGRPDREVLKKAPEVPAPDAAPDAAEANRAGYSRRKRPHPRNRRLHAVPAPESKKEGA